MENKIRAEIEAHLAEHGENYHSQLEFEIKQGDMLIIVAGDLSATFEVHECPDCNLLKVKSYTLSNIQYEVFPIVGDIFLLESKYEMK